MPRLTVNLWAGFLGLVIKKNRIEGRKLQFHKPQGEGTERVWWISEAKAKIGADEKNQQQEQFRSFQRLE
jgi:hypothetical protein